MNNNTNVGSRVTRRSGTKTKCFKYGGKNDKNKGTKSRYRLHPQNCTCAKCNRRRERAKFFPQISRARSV